MLGVEIKISANKFLVIVLVYTQPESPAHTYDLVFEHLEALPCLYEKQLLILGDFNVSEYHDCLITSTTSPRFQVLSEFANFFSLKQYNLDLNENNRLLDLVYANVDCSVKEAQCLITKRARHHPALEISVDLNVETLRHIPQNPDDASFNFRKADFHSLYET